jgi:O-antigen chain-terminating methyltransferase
VLDLGCGRGEWLEVLKEAGLSGEGIDRSSAACADCRARGLDVVHGDAAAYLASLPDASLGAVSAIQVIEHLPFDALLEVISQCIRVLQPGGLLILETPNPDNVLVATRTFYLDPTHRHPIPSPLLKFILQSQGLDPVDVLDLHPMHHEWNRVESEMDRYLVTNLFGGQDYAAIGHKPRPSPQIGSVAE